MVEDLQFKGFALETKLNKKYHEEMFEKHEQHREGESIDVFIYLSMYLYA